MAEYLTNDVDLTAIADAIRTKGGTSAQLEYPNGFVTAIENLSTGSGAVTIDEYADTNGGTVKDIIAVDISSDTVTAATLKKGYTAHRADGTAITGTLETEIVEKDVVFIDYDGRIVASKTIEEINAMTSDSDLPANPTHEGLTAQGWNWTVAQLKTQLTAMPEQKVYVGQMYTTVSGATEIDVEMPEGRLTPNLAVCPNGTVSVDWGDESATDSVTGVTTSNQKYISHTYTSAGKYTIKITPASGTNYALYCSSAVPLLSKVNYSADTDNKIYSNTIKRIRIGNNIDIKNSAFYNCHSLESITIPSSVTSIGGNSFYYCYSLKYVTIPKEVTAISSNVFRYGVSLIRISLPGGLTSIDVTSFYNNYSLKYITIPYGVTSNISLYSSYSLSSITIPSGVTGIGNTAYQYCYSLSKINIPSSVTSIGNNSFSNCYCIGKITIPSSVTSIGNTAFTACYGMKEYHFERTTPPTLGTTAFNYIRQDCIIYVPYSADHSVLAAYQAETNWSEYASYMQEEPQ